MGVPQGAGKRGAYHGVRKQYTTKRQGLQGGVWMAAALTQINGYAHVAARYGFEEAVFLHSLMFWYSHHS